MPTWVNGFEADLRSIEIYPAGSEISYRAGADGEWVGATIEEEILQTVALRVLGEELDLPRSAVSLRTPEYQRRELDLHIRRLTLALR